MGLGQNFICCKTYLVDLVFDYLRGVKAHGYIKGDFLLMIGD